MFRLIAFALLLAAAPLMASPARVGAIDNGLGLVPDFVDAASYPHLLVNYPDRVRIDYLGQDRECEAWASASLGKWGTAAVWRAKPGLADAVFAGLAQTGGLSSAELEGASPDEMAEGRVAVPAARIGLAWGRVWGRMAALGLAGQWSQTSLARSGEAPAAQGLATLDPMVRGAFGPLTFTSWADRQYSNQIVATPGLGLDFGFATLDAAADLAWSGLDNERREDYAAGGGLATRLRGESASWRGRAKLIVPWRDRTITASAGYGRLGLEAARHVDAGFGGATPSGWQADTDTHRWDSTPLSAALGLELRPTMSTYMVVSGSLRAERSRWLWESKAPRAGSSDPSDLAVASRDTTDQESWKAPLGIGFEMEPFKWLDLRANAEMAMAGQSRSRRLVEAVDTASGAVTQQTALRTEEDQTGAWALSVGAGFKLGSVAWDHRLDLSRQKLDQNSYTSSLTFAW